MKTQFEVGDCLGDMCDSGRRVPKKISDNFEVTSYLQIDMEHGDPDKVIIEVLKGAGCEKRRTMVNKFAYLVDDYPHYTAMYSYDYNLNIFTFERRPDMDQATARDDMSPTMEELADLDDE